MKVRIQISQLEDGRFVGHIPGLSHIEGQGDTAWEAAEDAMDLASLYLEPKEPEMLEFELEGAAPLPPE